MNRNPLNKISTRLWWFGDDIVGIGWWFYWKDHRKISLTLFRIGHHIEGLAQNLYRGA